MINTPELTAIIPVGPLAGHLNQLKETLMKCREFPIQVVIVCDDYEDGTIAELEVLLEGNFNNIQLITGHFGGPGPARNAGLHVAISPWVAFWDADDYPDPQESYRSLQGTQDEGIDLICHQYSINDANSLNKIYQSDLRDSDRDNLRAVGTQPGIWRFLFARDLISDSEFIDSRMGEDQEFLARMFTKKPKIKFVKNSNYRYLVSRSGQLTGNKSNISQLTRIAPLLKASYERSPSKYKESIRLMLNQVVLTMVQSKNVKVRMFALKHLALNPLLFLKSFGTILSEKRLRNV